MLISIHAPRVGGDDRHHQVVVRLVISIHAPRVGGDLSWFWGSYPLPSISIHAPRVGGDDS